jgi:hypothetical protein
MDIDLTSPLVATVNLTQTDNLWTFMKFLSQISLPVIATLFAVLLQGRVNLNLEESKSKNMIIQKKWEIFSRLKGLQIVLSQDFTDVYQLNIGSVYQEAASQLHTIKENRELHIKETQRLHDKLTESKAKFAEHRQYFYETIALIPVLFSNSYEIVDLTKTLNEFENNFGEIMLRKDVKTISEFKYMDDWRDKKISEVNRLTLNQVYSPIEELLNHLKADLSQTQ